MKSKLHYNDNNGWCRILSMTITAVKEKETGAALKCRRYCCQLCDVHMWLGLHLGVGTSLRQNQEHELFKQCGCQIGS